MIAGMMQSTSSLCQRDALDVLQYVPKHMRPRFRAEVISRLIYVCIYVYIYWNDYYVRFNITRSQCSVDLRFCQRRYAAVANVTFVVIHAISSKRRQRTAMTAVRAHFAGRDRKMLIRRRERLPLSIIIYDICCTDSRRALLAPRHRL